MMDRKDRADFWARMLLWAMLVFMLVALSAIANTEKAKAWVVLEPGVTWGENGACTEADGTEGVAALDGSCVTPADYDDLYSYDNLAATEDPSNPGQSIAETYGLTPDIAPASDRLRVFMGETLPTFDEYVWVVHGRVVM